MKSGRPIGISIHSHIFFSLPSLSSPRAMYVVKEREGKRKENMGVKRDAYRSATFHNVFPNLNRHPSQKSGPITAIRGLKCTKTVWRSGLPGCQTFLVHFELKIMYLKLQGPAEKFPVSQ